MASGKRGEREGRRFVSEHRGKGEIFLAALGPQRLWQCGLPALMGRLGVGIQPLLKGRLLCPYPSAKS